MQLCISKPGRNPNSSKIFKLKRKRGNIFAPACNLGSNCYHPAIDTLNNGEINKEDLKKIHLEYRHAIVQTFTDDPNSSKIFKLKRKRGNIFAPACNLGSNCLV
jgi:hypothetical protein